jgi:hypothetical protein
MRGRKPRDVTIRPDDLVVLRWIATKSSLPSPQVRRARIVLAIASGRRTNEIAREVGCNAATIWRACRATNSAASRASWRMTVPRSYRRKARRPDPWA